MNIHKRNRRSLRQIFALLAIPASLVALLWCREQSLVSQGQEFSPISDAYEVLPGSELCYSAAQNTLAVVSTGGWQLFDSSGRLIASDTTTMTTPVCITSDAVSVFYSTGDTVLQLVDANGCGSKLETDGAIRFVDVNQGGQLTVITDRDGYKGSVTVYSQELKPLFQWDAGTDLPLCARLSPKGQVAISCLTEEGSRLIIFRTDRQEPVYQQNFTGERILDMAFTAENRIALLTDTSMYLYNLDKGTAQTLTPTESYPVLFDSSSELAAVVCTTECFGGTGTLYALSNKGKGHYALSLPETVLDISVRKNRILLLTENELILCSRRLETIASLSLRQKAQHIFLRPDNTALAVGSHGVECYDFGR